MITIFTRKELCVTFDMTKQASVRSMLSNHNIDYSVKTINRNSPSSVSTGTRESRGTYGQFADSMYEYIIYVHKADYENAKKLIEKM